MKNHLQSLINRYNTKIKADITVTDLPEIKHFKKSIENILTDIGDDTEIIEYTRKTADEIKLLLFHNELI